MSRRRAPRPILLIILLGFVAIVVAGSVLSTDSAWANKDFVSYWAAGRLLIHGQNPYNSTAVFQTEKSAGYSLPGPLIMRNPPWALPLVTPLGLVGLRIAGILWMIGMGVCLSLSIRLLHRALGKPAGRFHLFGYCFPPVLACLVTGQSTLVILAGLALFLSLHRTRPFLSGLGLALCTIKPHLFIPFGLVLLVWILFDRAWRILAGVAVGVTAALSLVIFIDPHILPQYFDMLHSGRIQVELIPATSALPRLAEIYAFNRDIAWLQLMAAPVGAAWGLWYFLRRRRSWDWLANGSVLLIISLLSAPYAWFYDEVIAVPAILIAVLHARNAGRSLLPLGLPMMIAALELFGAVPFASGFYIWTAVAWVGAYMWMMRMPNLRPPDSRASIVAGAAV